MDSFFSEDHSGNQGNEDRDYLNELVGEDKKYKSPADLAKAKAHADDHISKLEQELAEARANQNSATRIEELLDRLENAKSQEAEPSTSSAQNQPGYERDDLEQYVEKIVTQKEQEKTARANIETLHSELRKQYGDSYMQQVGDALRSTGMSQEDFDYIAKQSPTAALRVLGGSQSTQSPPQTPPQSVNTQAFNQQSQTKRTKSYYDKLYQDNPALKQDRHTLAQEHNDALKLGPEFFDT